MNTQDRITAEEGARLIGMSGQYLRILARKGKLRHYKIGSLYFFDKQDILDLVKFIDKKQN
jgi:excisionase family DNA binding protein